MTTERLGLGTSTLAWMTRWAVAIIFLAAAPQKILAPADFAQNIAGFAILPDVLINFTALTLPWLEMIVVILLVCRVWTGPALFLANLMFAVFLAAVVSAYLRGMDIDCGCFGASTAASSSMTWYIVRDTLFLLLGLAAAWFNRTSNRF